MNILHITCSARGMSSESSRLSALIIDGLLERNPYATVVERHLGSAIGHVDERYAQSLAGAKPPLSDLAVAGSFAYSETLIREIEAANALVIGTPVHNFTVPSVLKVWIDHVVRPHRTFGYSPTGKVGLLADRPVFVAVASGGVHEGDQASQPDFLTPYLKAILGTIGLYDVTFLRMQGLARGEQAIASARLQAQDSVRVRFQQPRAELPHPQDLPH